VNESVLLPANDTLPPALLKDSLSLPPATRALPGTPIDWNNVQISSDGVDDPVEYHAKDSMFFDIKNKQIHLYGDAEVKYQKLTIQADYIVIDWNESTISATGRTNSLGELVGKPKFQEGTQNFTASNMRYNFKTYKGIILDAQTKQEGMNIVGEKAKFFGTGDDTTRSNIIYNRNAIFSTCDLEHPHFGIRSNKQKIVPDKVAVVGPSNLVIGDVPTPIWFPFGFFPLKIGARTGLIFPRDYKYEAVHGFGLQGVGWYFPLSEYYDLTLTTDIYMKGSFRINGASSYRKRYKYSGRGSLTFSRLRSEVEGVSVYNPALSLNWSHNQDAKAHPYRTLGGSVNIQTNDFARNNRTDADARLNSLLSSQMSFTQRFDKPFSLSASFSHSQNTNTRDVTIRFPVVNFQTQNLFPFKRKIPGAKESWYEKIQFNYRGDAQNQVTAKDSTLFTQKTLDDAKYAIRHRMETSTSFNLLKFFTVTPRVSYNEVWYFKTLDKQFDPTLVIRDTFSINPNDPTDTLFVSDTLKFGQVVEMENFGWKPYRNYSTGIGMNTRLFGTLRFYKGKLRGLRHTISPTFGFSFAPDQSNPRWGYFKTVRTSTMDTVGQVYNIFENNRIGYETPSPGGRQMNFSYSFGNQFEAKVYSRRDSTLKNVPLLRTLNISGNYNFAADSLKWSTISVSGNTGFFNNMTTFNFSLTLDPYDFNPVTGGRINKFYLDSKGKLLRVSNWNFGFQTNLTVGRIRDLIRGINSDVRIANQRREENANKEQDFLSLFEDFSISHNFQVRQFYNPAIRKDTVVVSTHAINSRGNIQLTKNWGVTVGNFGYDFQAKRVTYPDFSFHRDLHCWEMGFYWQPQADAYSFYIRVKPGKLDFINIPYGKGVQQGGAFSRF
jgi:hypothetical protein